MANDLTDRTDLRPCN